MALGVRLGLMESAATKLQLPGGMPDPANSNAERYDMRPDDEGWTVYTVRTGEPARVEGVP